MTKFTQAEVEARVEALRPPQAVLSRLVEQDAGETILGVQDTVARALNNDVDGLYYLIGLFIASERKTIDKALAALVVLDRMALGAQRETPSATNYLPQILALLAELAFALDGRRAQLTTQLSTLTRLYANSCKSKYGEVSVGVPSTVAAEAAINAVRDTEKYSAALGTNAEQLMAAVRRYKGADFWKASPTRQVIWAHSQLSTYDDPADPSQIILDATVAASVVGANVTINNPETAKYTGTVTVNAGLPPKENGFFLPRALPKATYGVDQVKTVTVDGIYGGTVTYPLSPSPALSAPVPGNLFTRTESGSAANGNGAAVTFPQNLKTTVVPGSVTVRAHAVGTDLPMIITDNGVGGFNAPAVGGSINYLTGVATVTFPFAVRAYDPVHWSYTYNPIGDMKVRDAAGVFVSNVNTFEIFKHNTLLSGAVSQVAALVNLAALRAEINTTFAANNVFFTAGVDALTIDSDQGGGYAQLMLPAYAITPVINAAFGAPTWSTPPVKFNDTLRAINSVVPRAFGKDTQPSGVVFSAPIKGRLDLKENRTLRHARVAYTVTTGNKNKVSVPGITGITAGTTVVEFISPFTGRMAAQSLAGIIITLEADVPFPVTTGTTLAASVDVVFDVIDVSMDLVSRSTHGGATLNVLVGTLWPAGLYRSYTTSLTLNKSTAAAYGLRPGDLCFQGEKEIGVVTSVTGSNVNMSLNQQFAYYPAPIVSVLVYPYTSLTFRGLGNVRLAPVLASVWASIAAIDAALAGFSQAAPTYIYSGAAHNTYVEKSAALLAALTAYSSLLSGYAYNKVDAVDKLLAHLEQERLTGVVAALRQMEFDSIDAAGIEGMSEQLDVQTTLATLADDYGAREPFITVGIGRDPLNEYTSSGD